MLKEYVLEAISLLTEVLLGKPQTALAQDCVFIAYAVPCGNYCSECGADKRLRDTFCYRCFGGGGCYWFYQGCQCTYC